MLSSPPLAYLDLATPTATPPPSTSQQAMTTQARPQPLANIELSWEEIDRIFDEAFARPIPGSEDELTSESELFKGMKLSEDDDGYTSSFSAFSETFDSPLLRSPPSRRSSEISNGKPVLGEVDGNSTATPSKKSLLPASLNRVRTSSIGQLHTIRRSSSPTPMIPSHVRSNTSSSIGSIMSKAEGPLVHPLRKKRSRLIFHNAPDGKSITAIIVLPRSMDGQPTVNYKRGDLHVSWRTITLADSTQPDGSIVRERKEKRFSRVIPLPEGVPFKDVKAVMNERKLSLTFPSGKISLATGEDADEEEDA